MKKNQTLKVLSTLFLATLMASCGGNEVSQPASTPASTPVSETTSVTPSVPAGETSVETSTSEEAHDGINLTEGVYNNLLGGKYELLIKFYDSETFYLQNETTGYRGKYKIVEEEIVYSYTQEDGSIADTAANPDSARWIKGDTVIYFYEEDGVTPLSYNLHSVESGETHDDSVVIKGEAYAVGTPSNALAYDKENNAIISFRGNNGSRTLNQTTKDFTMANEKDIIQAQYMVSSLPSDANGKVESDYFLKLSQKGYETNIAELQDEGIEIGLFAKEGNNYKLTDTISGTEATLEVSDNGAVVKIGSKEINLVAWEEVVSYAARLEGARGSLSLNEDGTFVLKGGMAISGTYALNKDGTLEMEFAENAYSASLGSATINGDDISVTVAIVAGGNNMSLEFAGKVSGTLYVKGAVSLLGADSLENVYGTTKLHMDMKSDSKIVLSAQGQELVSAFFYLNTTTHQITFKNATKGEFTFSLGNPASITWTGKLSDANETDDTYTFQFAATDLGSIVSAKVEEKVTYSTEWNTRAVDLVFFVDNTVKFTIGGTEIATANWAMSLAGGVPSVTFEEASSGTFAAGFGENSTFVFSWTGTVPGMNSETTISISIPTSEIAGLR